MVAGASAERQRLELEPGAEADSDTVVKGDDFKIFIDQDSVKYLEGASVDFIDNLQESGFKVDAPTAGLKKPEGPLAEAVLKVIEEKINPAVASTQANELMASETVVRSANARNHPRSGGVTKRSDASMSGYPPASWPSRAPCWSTPLGSTRA